MFFLLTISHKNRILNYLYEVITVSYGPDMEFCRICGLLIDECYEGYESYTFLRERVMAHRDDGGSICFFDGALSSPSLQKDIDRIFYELGHHSRTSFMMASQELFHQRSKYRTASKQLANLWLFSSKS